MAQEGGDSSRKLISDEKNSHHHHEEKEIVVIDSKSLKINNNNISRIIHDNNSDSNYNSNEDDDDQQLTTKQSTNLIINSNDHQDSYDLDEDYNSKLLSESSTNKVYNECTIPINENNDISKSIFTKAQISACLAPLTTVVEAAAATATTMLDANNNNNGGHYYDDQNNSQTTPLTNGFNINGGTNLDGLGGGACAGQFTMIDLNKSALDSDQGYYYDDHDSDDRVLSSPNQVKFINNSNNKADMFHSINNLRLNVNNHIIGSSKNVMGRMRKLSLNELNRHSSSKSGRRYKVAFYVALCSLSMLFLYLIYQNLFNDR